jgi:hypothetical protein
MREMRDFTLGIYRNLCNVLLEKNTPVGVLCYLQQRPECAAIIRHDVDVRPQHALILAGIEKDLGISSTYYFRTVPEVFNVDIMQKIHSMGHEIGFHYEVLDKAKGDITIAIDIFEKELKMFPFDIKTICMHGNPLTPWVNKDMWKGIDFKKFGIIGEAYLSINLSDFYYFSDTGRSWNGKYSVKDLSETNDVEIEKIAHTKNLIEFIRRKKGNYYVVTHPPRWNDALIPWAAERIRQPIKNIGKSGIKYIRKTR